MPRARTEAMRAVGRTYRVTSRTAREPAAGEAAAAAPAEVAVRAVPSAAEADAVPEAEAGAPSAAISERYALTPCPFIE